MEVNCAFTVVPTYEYACNNLGLPISPASVISSLIHCTIQSNFVLFILIKLGNCYKTIIRSYTRFIVLTFQRKRQLIIINTMLISTAYCSCEMTQIWVFLCLSNSNTLLGINRELSIMDIMFIKDSGTGLSADHDIIWDLTSMKH